MFKNVATDARNSYNLMRVRYNLLDKRILHACHFLLQENTKVLFMCLFSLCRCRSYCQTGKGQVWSHSDGISKGN